MTNEEIAQKIHTHLTTNGGATLNQLCRPVEIHDILEALEDEDQSEKEIIIPLPNGNTLRCGEGEENQYGGYVRICDPNEGEILYFDKEEWAEAPEEVMGSIFRVAMENLDNHLTPNSSN